MPRTARILCAAVYALGCRHALLDASRRRHGTHNSRRKTAHISSFRSSFSSICVTTGARIQCIHQMASDVTLLGVDDRVLAVLLQGGDLTPQPRIFVSQDLPLPRQLDVRCFECGKLGR